MSAGIVFYTRVVLLVAVLWFGLPLRAAQFAGGTGEPNDPYQIATAEQLVSIGSDPNLLGKHFVLLNDIDFDPNLPGGRVFTRAVIAPDTGEVEGGFGGGRFTGTLDGGGHTIRNLIVRGIRVPFLGLFGATGNTAVIKDLNMEHADIDEPFTGGGWYRGILVASNQGRLVRCRAGGLVSGAFVVGGLAGSNGGHIVDCSSHGYVFGDQDAGGLVGRNYTGCSITNCLSTSEISVIGVTRPSAGGLVGLNCGYLMNCHATGNILGWYSTNVGGLVGNNEGLGTIVGCYASGDVEDDGQGQASVLGGLVGNMSYSGSQSAVINCYATGNIRAGDNSEAIGSLIGRSEGRIAYSYATGAVTVGKNSRNIGGLVGEKTGGDIASSFWNIETTGLSESAGGTGLATVQMRTAETFVSAGWDLKNTWAICEGRAYPRLRWEEIDCNEP